MNRREEPCFHPNCINNHSTPANLDDNACWDGLDRVFCCRECKKDYLERYATKIQEAVKRRRVKNRRQVQLHRIRKKLALEICDLLGQLYDIELPEKAAMELVITLDLSSPLCH